MHLVALDAATIGGNAIMNVRCDQKEHTMATAGYIEGRAMVIVDESDQAVCSFWAETIKPQSTRCKHCGSDIPKMAV